MNNQPYNLYQDFFERTKEVLEGRKIIKSCLIQSTHYLTQEQQMFNDFLKTTVADYLRSHSVYKELEESLNNKNIQMGFKKEQFLTKLLALQASQQFVNQICYFINAAVKIKTSNKELEQFKVHQSNMIYHLEKVKYHKYSSTSLFMTPQSKMIELLKIVHIYECFLLSFDEQLSKNQQTIEAGTECKKYRNDHTNWLTKKMDKIIKYKQDYQVIKNTYLHNQHQRLSNQDIPVQHINDLFNKGLVALEENNKMRWIANGLADSIKKWQKHNQQTNISCLTTLENQTSISNLVKQIQNIHDHYQFDGVTFSQLVKFISDCYLSLQDQSKLDKIHIPTLSMQMKEIKGVLQSLKYEPLNQRNHNFKDFQKIQQLYNELCQAHKFVTQFQRAKNFESSEKNPNDLLVIRLQNLCSLMQGLRNSKLQDLDAAIKTLSDEKVKNHQELSQKDNKISTLEDRNKSLQQAFDNLTLKTKNKENIQSSTRSKVQDLESKISQMNDLRFKNEQLNRQIGQLQNKGSRLQQQLKLSQQNSKKEVRSLKDNLEYVNQQLAQAVEESRLQQQKIKQQENTLTELKKLKEQEKQRNKLLQTTRLYIKQLEGQLETQKNINQTSKSSEAILIQKINNLDKQLDSQKENVQRIKLFYEEKEAQFRSQLAKIKQSMIPYSASLFNDQIFFNKEYQKQTLINHLQKYMNSPLQRTSLIYKYDTRNKANFHQYIDQVSNLCLVVKTSFAIIAGFYPGVHKQKEVMNKGGLLVSVTNNERYTLHKKKPNDKMIYRGMTYDQYYIIYGNAEIRIKTGQNTVFSNFGVNNGFYNTRGHKVENFLNEQDKREVEFKTYEIYQLFFKHQGCNEI